MDCRKVCELLPDYSVELLVRRTHQAVAEHLTGCSGCRGELAAMDHAMTLVVAHAALTPPPGLWNGVFNRLTAGEEAVARLSWWDRLWHGPRRALVMGMATVAAAACALLFQGGRPIDLKSLPASKDQEVMALVRQHALSAAESPFGDRAIWEIQAARSAREAPGEPR
jgi:hypothetical protein